MLKNKSIDELVKLTKSNCKEAQLELFDRFKPLIKKYAYKNSNILDSTEDLSQEAFLIIIDTAKKYKEESNIPYAAYLKKAIEYGLKRKTLKDFCVSLNEQIFDEFELIDFIQDENALIPDKLIKKEVCDELYSALLKLSLYEREIIINKHFYKVNIKKIAEQKNHSYAKVAKCHSRAIIKLKKILEENME